MNSANWWANKLGAPAPAVSTPPVQQPMYQPAPPPPQQVPVNLPQSATTVSRCPGCGSGNYGGTLETRPRCYDCGYPITQSGSGAAGINQGQASGPTQAAKQVATGGWNPTTIIGKIE